MTLPDIEVLHIKCQQALGGEISASDSEHSEGEEQTKFLCKMKKPKNQPPFHNPPLPTRTQHANTNKL